MTERELIKRCLAGDREARRRLYDRTCIRVHRLLLRLTGNAEDAADLTQDTYLKGLTRLDQFDGRSAIATWFYRIAINEAMQFRRRRALDARKLQDLALEQSDDSADSATESPLDLDDALVNLSIEDRAMLLLRYQEGMDYRRMAEVLECAEGTVASRLNRARDRLREALLRSYR